MASRVTILFARTNWSSSLGTAVISFDLPSTQRCPSTRPWALAQALTTCRGDCPCPRSNERRIVLPSMTTTSRSKPAMSEPAQAVKPASKASGSISMNTRRKVSCEGMPFGSSRKVRSHSSLLRPYRRAMSSQLSAQAITAHTAITRMSVRRCSILPLQRGSAITPKCCTRLLTGITRSCSSSQEQVIRYQPRSADKNFMRRPCTLTRTAHCCCGSLQLTATGDPTLVAACHCTECQRRTGAAFGVAAYFEKSQVQAEGAFKVYTRDGQEGRIARMHFCPECGTTV